MIIFNTFLWCVQLNLETGEVDGVVKFENGAIVFVIGGNNIGRVGTLMHVEHHPGSYEIVHIKDSQGNNFATRLSNIFTIGQGKKPLIKLPKGDGQKLSLIQERNARIEAMEDDDWSQGQPNNTKSWLLVALTVQVLAEEKDPTKCYIIDAAY